MKAKLLIAIGMAALLFSGRVSAMGSCFDAVVAKEKASCFGPVHGSSLEIRQAFCDITIDCPEHHGLLEWRLTPDFSNFETKRALGAADSCRLLLLQANHRLNNGQYEMAQALSAHARQMSISLPEPALYWLSAYFEGVALKHLGSFEWSDSLLTQALNASARMENDRYRLNALYALYELKELQDLHAVALEYFKEYHRLHQLLFIENAAVKSEQDSLQLVSMNVDEFSARNRSGWMVLTFLFFATVISMWLYRSMWLPKLMVLIGEQRMLFQGNLFQEPATVAISTKESQRTADEEILVDDEKIERLVNLRKSRLLTNEDWDAFRAEFLEIYPGFIIRLKHRHPEATNSDQKLACLIRMHMGTKEVAKAMVISEQSVNTARYRLRNRLNLAERHTLEEYIMSI